MNLGTFLQYLSYAFPNCSLSQGSSTKKPIIKAQNELKNITNPTKNKIIPIYCGFLEYF
jgi:hypothetical protein